MRWKTKKQRDVFEWHEWFAWKPVEVPGGWVWLERVERRMVKAAVYSHGELVSDAVYEHRI